MPRPKRTRAKKPVSWSYTEKAGVAIASNEHANVQWSPSGNQLAILANGTIHVWSLDRQRIVAEYSHLPALNGNVLAWAPHLRLLGASSRDKVLVVDPENGQLKHLLTEHNDFVQSIAWSPSGDLLFSGSADRTMKVWNWRQNRSIQTFNLQHSVQRVVLDKSGAEVFCASGDGIVAATVGSPRTRSFRAWHKGAILDMAIHHTLGVLASGAENDPTVRIWDYERGAPMFTLEGHTGSVIATSFSADGALLATKSKDGKVLIWNTGTWDLVGTFAQPTRNWRLGLAFHPRDRLLASVGADNSRIAIFDFGELRQAPPAPAGTTLQFCNAKVMLVGDTGVGKTALGLVLSGEPYRATDSTHKRNVTVFEREKLALAGGETEEREVLLWDLAGQPGYRLVNQLHLPQAALAVVVFDARSEVDPIAGVKHWIRAMRQAERVSGRTAPVPKLLVAGRTDRGGVALGSARVEELRRDGFLDYYETSAKENWGIAQLAEAIRTNIDWAGLPRVRSTAFLHEIQQFILGEKSRDRRLSTSDDLYRSFLHLNPGLEDGGELRDQFNGAVGCLEARDLIRRFSFGNLLLLEPELLDSYASAMILAAKDEPDGLGCLAEEVAISGAFRMPRSERLESDEAQRLLLIATVQDLLNHELVLREYSEWGPQLVFPSQFTREHSELERFESPAAIYRFSGSPLNVYATLVVRLSHSGVFTRESLWRNAAIFATPGTPGWCGIRLKELDEGEGELQLYFSEGMRDDARLHFESYLRVHLERRTLADRLSVLRPLACTECDGTITERQVQARRERGYESIACPVCGTDLPLPPPSASVVASKAVARMDDAADAVRKRQVAASMLQGKQETGTYDVFLCYSSGDRRVVRGLAERLMGEGVHPWLDEKDLRPGAAWIDEISTLIERIPTVAVFVGASGVGPWQDKEVQAVLTEMGRRDARIIPVLLPDARSEPQLPLFLRGLTWVDFRHDDPDPMQQLVWGITGTRGV